MQNKKRLAEKALEQGGGILRLAPTWVPRSFCRPGKRIKLHPDDYFVLGQRGGIDERWFSSTTWAENGPDTPEDEGLSYVVVDDEGKEKVLLRDVVELLGAEVIGETLWNKYHRWPMFSKFFDNAGPLPHHIHHRDQHANRVGASGKPEMYFFPSQLNNHGGEFPFTFFGLNPETTKEEVLESLKNFTKGDNRITSLAMAYKLDLDTGWDVPPGVLHAPGSLCTYEPQFASDVYAMYQSVLLNGQIVGEDLLWKNTPEEELGNYEYLLDVIDWDKNVDPDFHKNRFMAPKPVRPMEDMIADGYIEEWICYKCETVCAKRLTVLPGQTVTIKDSAPYGLICLEGHGTFGKWEIESPALIHYVGFQPFIATLSTMTIGRGFAQVYSNGKPYTISDPSFKVIGQGYFLGIPVPIILLVIFCIIGLVILTMTTFGRYVFAIGGNMNAAKLSGVRTQRVQLMVYVMSSICAWMVGLILAARISSGQPTAGESYEMDAIAATAIGGTSMSGGIGSLSGTIIGFVILGLLQNSMNLMNINSFWQQIVKGLLIIIAVFLDMRTKGKKA